MYVEEDKWRELGRAATERMESTPPVPRFSRRLLIAGALVLIAVGVFGWL